MIAAIVPTVLFEAVPHSGAFEKEVADVSERHLLLARNIGLTLERYSVDLKAAFKSLVLNIISGNKLTNTREFLAGLNFRHICVATLKDGKVVDALNEEVVPCPDRIPNARFKYFLEVATPENVAFTPVLAGPKGQPLLYIVWIVGDKLAVGAVYTDYIVGLGKSISFGERGHAAIVDHTGKIIAHPQPKWRQEMKDISKVSAVKRMLNKESGVETFYSPALKDDMIAGFTWVKGAGWGVMIPQPLSELKLRADESQRHAVGGLVLGVLLAVLLSWLMAGYLTTPVLKVVEAAKRFTSGDRDVRVPKSQSSLPREIIELTETMNSMVDAVEQSERNLRDALVFAEHANKSKSEFLANMSHELRTPLNAIIGFSDALAKETFGPTGNSKNLESIISIHDAGNHLLQIIGDILDISKIEAGEAVVEEAEVDAKTSINTCVTMLKTRSQDAAVNVKVDVLEGLPTLCADQRMVKQILINLLSNAVKFTSAGGLVTVSARLNDVLGIEFVVADTGVGIAAENIEKVMQPFGQVAESYKRGHGGTGLGLPICTSLMDLHDGSLTLESEFGKGTSVIISFPPERTIQPESHLG